MNTRSLELLGMKVQLAFMRINWSNGIVFAICAAGAVGWLWGVPHLRAEAEIQREAISQVRKSIQSPGRPVADVQRSVDEERLSAFYDIVGERRYAEQQVKTLFAIARKSGLTLRQAEYKFATDTSGHFYSYQILLPVKGPYSAVRQFCEQTLLAIPFASLDEINFRRDAIGSRTLEAKLHFTLYLNDVPAVAQRHVAPDLQGSRQ